MWPNYRCDELGGQGWRAQVKRSSPAATTVKFLQATSSQGRPYEDACLQTSQLMSLKPPTPDEQGP